jgi:hypothetical protein
VGIKWSYYRFKNNWLIMNMIASRIFSAEAKPDLKTCWIILADPIADLKTCWIFLAGPVADLKECRIILAELPQTCSKAGFFRWSRFRSAASRIFSADIVSDLKAG